MYLSQGIFGFILFSIYYYDWILITNENKKRKFNTGGNGKGFLFLTFTWYSLSTLIPISTYIPL